MKKVRARYAPSPTGLLHIGNARTALFNYLFARHHGGDFIIRIEDTDTARNVPGGEESQLKYLKWLGMSWDEGPDIGGQYGPYHQLKRLDLYQEYAQKLLDMGLAYKEYKEGSDKFAVRFKVPENTVYTFNDLIRGKLEFQSKEIEDWIILKENGIPTYNFAVVIDDHFMKITHVFRGEEHITNTPKQLMVYDAFGWDYPEFGHMTIIVNEQKKKLSKRDTSTLQFIGDYERLGYLPEAMINFLALLGFAPDKEILSHDELIEVFDEHRLSKAPSYFDRQKLAFINSQYLKKLDDATMKTFLTPFLKDANIEIKNDVWLTNLISVLRDRLDYGAQIVEYYHTFFRDEFEISEEAKQELNQFDRMQTMNLIETLLTKIQSLSFDDATEIESLIKDLGKKLGIKGKALFMPIRIATTGEAHGPSLPVSMLLLGKDVITKRLNETIKVMKEQTV